MTAVVSFLLIGGSDTGAQAIQTRCTARTDVRGIPLVEFPAPLPKKAQRRVRLKKKTAAPPATASLPPAQEPPPRRLAIMLTGDGGWRRIDVHVTDRFRQEGVPVVGFLTPDYFKTLKTPDESACDLERVIRFYMTAWNCERVILIGYSRGADVLPFMTSRLSEDLRPSIDVIALLGLEPMIDFKYHPSWLPFTQSKEKQYPVKPEVEKLRGHKILCVYGEKEKDTLCRTLDPSLAVAVREPGSHHFGGNYHGIADTILAVSAERPGSN